MRNTFKLDPSKYNDIPVKYCSKCYSLQIGSIEGLEDSDYCMHCGSSEILEGNIYAWEELYEKRYGHKYVEVSRSPRQAYLDSLSLTELKRLVYNNNKCFEVIKTMYPVYPFLDGKLETCMEFFELIARDKRIEELKKLLIDKI